MCSDDNGSSVSWTGDLPFAIDGVDVADFSDDHFLVELLATLPFDGAEPSRAKAWVVANVDQVVNGEERVAVFGGQTFILVGSPMKLLTVLAGTDHPDYQDHTPAPSAASVEPSATPASSIRFCVASSDGILNVRATPSAPRGKVNSGTNIIAVLHDGDCTVTITAGAARSAGFVRGTTSAGTGWVKEKWLKRA